MWKTEKNFNKWIIGAIIGTTIIWLGGLSMTPKGKSFWRRMWKKTKKTYRFMLIGWSEMKKAMKKDAQKKQKKSLEDEI